jgi:hypothetical protein
MLQIELKEDLARRREELENRIGRHDMQATVEASQPASLGTKETELTALRAAVEELEVTIEGTCNSICNKLFTHATTLRYARRDRGPQQRNLDKCR